MLKFMRQTLVLLAFFRAKKGRGRHGGGGADTEAKKGELIQQKIFWIIILRSRVLVVEETNGICLHPHLAPLAKQTIITGGAVWPATAAAAAATASAPLPPPGSSSPTAAAAAAGLRRLLQHPVPGCGATSLHFPFSPPEKKYFI